MVSSYADANQRLLKYVPAKGVVREYTLETMYALMEYLGNPQNTLNVVHVAGTSGKTSTSYYIAALLQAAGKNVGLSVSPHIDHINERAQINLTPLPEKEYCRRLEVFLDKIETSGLNVTYFEVLVAFAYWTFADLKVDYAVMEVGLGGLLDGTNVVNRSDKVCVITDIGLDHTAILGDTYSAIAQQKAGIITNGNTVLVHPQAKDVMDVIRTAARNHSGNVIEVPDNGTMPESADLPTFQVRNFSLALAAVEYIHKRDGLAPLTDTAIRQSTEVYIPARMEVVPYGKKTVILDGSHNQQKIHALATAIAHKYPDTKISMLVSFGENKTTYTKEALSELRTISDTITLTTFKRGQDEPRAPIDPDLLAQYCRKLGFKDITIESDPATAFMKVLDKDADIILVTGSFYLLNHIKIATT